MIFSFQTLLGKYSDPTTDTLLAIGNGTSDNDRKNAFEILTDGRAKVFTKPQEDNDVVNKGYVSEVIESNATVYPSIAAFSARSETCHSDLGSGTTKDLLKYIAKYRNADSFPTYNISESSVLVSNFDTFNLTTSLVINTKSDGKYYPLASATCDRQMLTGNISGWENFVDMHTIAELDAF